MQVKKYLAQLGNGKPVQMAADGRVVIEEDLTMLKCSIMFGTTKG